MCAIRAGRRLGGKIQSRQYLCALLPLATENNLVCRFTFDVRPGLRREAIAVHWCQLWRYVDRTKLLTFMVFDRVF